MIVMIKKHKLVLGYIKINNFKFFLFFYFFMNDESAMREVFEQDHWQKVNKRKREKV